MRTMRFSLCAALIAGVWLASSASASAQAEQTQTLNNIAYPQVDRNATLSAIEGGSYRRWDRWPDKDRLVTMTHNRLHVKLFGVANTIHSSQADGTADRNRAAGRPVSASGFIWINGNAVVRVAPIDMPTDAAFDQGAETGSVTFYEEQKVYQVFPAISVKLRVFGRLNSRIAAWMHTTATPQTIGESDFSLTSASLDGEVTVRATLSAPGGGSVFGELQPLRGNFAVNSGAKREYVPGFWGSTTRFTLTASTPAKVTIGKGNLSFKPSGKAEQEIAYWGSGLSFDPQLEAPRSKAWTITGSF